jgi:hypothetical protein
MEEKTRQRGDDENAVRMKSGCSPICHMMGIEVCSSINATSLPASCWWNDGMNVRDGGSKSPILCNGRLLKCQCDIKRITF